MYPSPKVRVFKNYPQFMPLSQNFTLPTFPLHRMLSSDCEIAFNTFLWIDRRLSVVFFLICVINLLLEPNTSNCNISLHYFLLRSLCVLIPFASASTGISLRSSMLRTSTCVLG